MIILKHGGRVDKAASPKETPFEYLLPELKSQPSAHIPGDPVKVTADLKALGAALVDDAGPRASAPPTAPGDPPAAVVEVNSNIPAVYTYWGQFIDHDMTANTDRDAKVMPDVTKSPVAPVHPDIVPRILVNLRRPTLDLDSVYGNGPGLDDGYPMPDPGDADEGFYDGVKMRVGENAIVDLDGQAIDGVKIPDVNDFERDLPRIGPLIAAHVITEDDLPEDIRHDPKNKTLPFIGDSRNDENLILAQFHLAVLRFHNNVVDAVEADPHAYGLVNATDAEKFACVQRLVRWHYQWLVVNDYLPTVTQAGMVDKVMLGGNKFYEPLAGGTLFAPLEYSVAAFRFGHTMVRGAYDHNRNFGRAVPPEPNLANVATFDQLFQFTGNGHTIDPNDITKSVHNPFRHAATLPFNWPIEWDRMTNKGDANEAHFARKIDTRLVDPLHNMVNRGVEPELQDDAGKPIRQLLRSLAQRNLLRGYLLSIPTGQAMAKAMGIAPLTAEEIQRGNTQAVNTALVNGGFVANTPLWFYVLKEAEIREDGNSLGELGSRIVVETQIGIIRNDPSSYLNADDGPWDPSLGVRLESGDPIVTIRDFFNFADLPA